MYIRYSIVNALSIYESDMVILKKKMFINILNQMRSRENRSGSKYVMEIDTIIILQFHANC